MNKFQNVGIAWFYEDDWEEWKNISEDQIEETYENWLISAKITESNLEKEYEHVEEVFIVPSEFKRWCKKHIKKINSSSRSEYVTWLLLNK
ncbi:MAG: hypothetical protein JEY94_01015 [Melioribacteraceae bacterium]|nr:hypothetical protein [Melioribacteraceae bacterium]